MLIKEKNGSYTVNVNGGEVMSTRSFGQVGKSYNSASEAFKDATWSTAIQRPEKNEYHHIWSVLGVLLAVGITIYVLNHFLPYQ
jgi:hypothetical protein